MNQDQVIFKRPRDRRTRSYQLYKKHTRHQWNIHWQYLAGATARNEMQAVAYQGAMTTTFPR